MAVIDELLIPLNTRFVAGPVGVPAGEVAWNPDSAVTEEPRAFTAVTDTV